MPKTSPDVLLSSQGYQVLPRVLRNPYRTYTGVLMKALLRSPIEGTARLQSRIDEVAVEPNAEGETKILVSKEVFRASS